MAVMASARVERDVILIPERSLDSCQYDGSVYYPCRCDDKVAR